MNIRVTEIASRAVNISWEDGGSGNPPVISYQVFLLNDSHIFNFTVSTTSIYLEPLLPFTNYTITIVAMNVIGVSNNSQPFSFVTEEEGKFNIYI